MRPAQWCLTLSQLRGTPQCHPPAVRNRAVVWLDEGTRLRKLDCSMQCANELAWKNQGQDDLRAVTADLEMQRLLPTGISLKDHGHNQQSCWVTLGFCLSCLTAFDFSISVFDVSALPTSVYLYQSVYRSLYGAKMRWTRQAGSTMARSHLNNLCSRTACATPGPRTPKDDFCSVSATNNGKSV